MENFYAEHDTDRVIRNNYFPDYSYKGTIVEVGAATPTFLSTTKHFKENGWRAVHIEPNPNFIQNHLDAQNEIYPYACGENNIDNIDFTIVSTNQGENTNHSYSSFEIKDGYRELNPQYFDSLQKSKIKVNCRKLDSIIEEAKINYIDVLSVDTEGWEIEVMKGLSKIQPTLVILENVLNLNSYTEYMESRNYKLDRIQAINFFYIKK